MQIAFCINRRAVAPVRVRFKKMGRSTSTSFGRRITGSSHQERVSVREQWTEAKPGAEGDARASHILNHQDPISPRVNNRQRRLPQWPFTWLAVVCIQAGDVAGDRQSYTITQGVMLRPELKWSPGQVWGRGDVPGGATPGNWKPLVCSGKIFAGGLQSSACKGCVNP